MGRVAGGDAEAFAEIYHRHSARALLQARRLCASSELAEEIAQDAFLSLWRSAHRYRPALGGVGALLSGMVRNRAIDAWRHEAVRPVEVAAVAAEHAPGQALSSAVGSSSDQRELLLSLIAALPRPQKEAIFLAYFAGLTQSEIASWAGAPLGTIKGRLRLGLDKLRPALEQQDRMTHALAA